MSNSRPVNYSFGVNMARPNAKHNVYLERVKKLHDRVYGRINSERENSNATSQENIVSDEDQKQTVLSNKSKFAFNQGL